MNIKFFKFFSFYFKIFLSSFNIWLGVPKSKGTIIVFYPVNLPKYTWKTLEVTQAFF